MEIFNAEFLTELINYTIMYLYVAGGVLGVTSVLCGYHEVNPGKEDVRTALFWPISLLVLFGLGLRVIKMKYFS